ncbi:MAG: hypothetical protein RLY16_1457 [Bacteroidota bacterium]|jgi:PAS domain S-box-containing protein
MRTSPDTPANPAQESEYLYIPAQTNIVKNITVSIVITDTDFNIQNSYYENITHPGIKPGTIAKYKVGSAFNFEPVGINKIEMLETVKQKGYWQGDIVIPIVTGFEITQCTIAPQTIDAKSGWQIKISKIDTHTSLAKQEEETHHHPLYDNILGTLHEGVVIINKEGHINRANERAAEILGIPLPQLIGQLVAHTGWKAVRNNGSQFEHVDFPIIKTLYSGIAIQNEVMGINRPDGSRVWLSINSSPVFTKDQTTPIAAIAAFSEITDLKNTHEKLKESEILFSSFMKNSPTLGWVYDENSRLIYGNPLFADITGLPNGFEGKKLRELTKSEDIYKVFDYRIKQVLHTGKTIIAEDAMPDKDGNLRYYISYWFLLPVNNNKRLIGGHAIEITDRKLSTQEMEKYHERMNYAANASSDAIWDLDIATQTIYRSDSFSHFSGYSKAEIQPEINWLIEKVHPADREKLEKNIQHCLENNVTNWTNEYRLRIADGSYRHILDRAFAIYDNGILTRVIGGMQDITEIKISEARELNDKIQKQKIINQATIKAQEDERNRISGELHDNVNQLLMSAKLHVGVAVKNLEKSPELLSKASDYILMAVEEIRALTKRLNNSILNITGLEKCILEITNNMQLSTEIEVISHIDEQIAEKLSNEQQLMFYRIIQEQTNNIIKYAEAEKAFITLKEKNGKAILIISDNGKGFVKEDRLNKGLGFTNIFNRVHAFSGDVEITTEPGKGCNLHVTIPIKEA